MRNVLIKAIAFAVLFAAPAVAEEEIERGTFLCISEMSTGFKVMEADWKRVEFNVGSKYLIRPLKEGDLWYDPNNHHAYGVFNFGEDFVAAWDDEGFGFAIDEEYHPSLAISARGFGFSTFQMNRQTMRYTAAYLGDWASQSPNAEQSEGSTPFIEIGSCTRL